MTEIPKYRNRSVFAKNYCSSFHMSRKKLKNYKVANPPSDKKMYRNSSVMAKNNRSGYLMIRNYFKNS